MMLKFQRPNVNLKQVGIFPDFQAAVVDYSWPMSLIETLMRRAVLTMVAGLCAALVLALWRAQIDTDREAQGAAQIAQLVSALSLLQNVPQAELPGHLQTVQTLNASGGLRHLQLRLRDAQGHELVASPLDATGAATGFSWLHPFGGLPDWRMEWSIARPQGPPLTGILTANPGSEQEEALSGVLGLLMILLVFSTVLLLGIYMSVQRAFRPLHDILEAIGDIEKGDTTRRLHAMSCRELDRVGGALNHLADALDVAQRSRRQLGARIQTLQEDERAQIALDLHDEFGQQVTGLRANVRWLIRRTQGMAEVQSVLLELDEECVGIQQGMRHLLQRLCPHSNSVPGNEGGLAQWLQSLIDGWQAKAGNKIHFELVCPVDGLQIPNELAVALYRMTQEALTNIARHAQAKKATVHIRREAQDLYWQVADDGVGIMEPEQAMLRGRGLAGLRERVWTQGGTLAIQSSQAEGTTLEAHFALLPQGDAA
jgi:two-component system sensor histidine kinase UhpB